MKLLYCPSCGDIFNLDIRYKQCHCGRVRGMYINYREAVVNGEGVSLAMGNGSFEQAIMASFQMKEDFRQDDPWKRHPTSIVCWARPHEGPANPNTRVVPGLKENDDAERQAG